MEKFKKQEEILKMISMFRERELLWNTSSFSYRRNDLKKKALEEIATECHMTVECVKKKLKTLRSTYVMEKKKVDQSKKSGADAADVYVPSLFWNGEMSFLDGSISTRKSKDNVSNNILDVSISVDEATTSKSFQSDSSYTPSTSRKRKREDDIDTDKFDEAIDKIVNINKPTNDAFSAFAEYMAMTLRTMPEETAYRAMNDMQQLLFERKFNKEVGRTKEFKNIKPSSADQLDSSYLYCAISDSEESLSNDDSCQYYTYPAGNSTNF